MKRLLTLLVMLSFTLSQGLAQCSLPNGDFEEWEDLTEAFAFELDLELVEEVTWPSEYSTLLRLVDLANSSFILPYFDTGMADQPLFAGVSRVEPGANGSNTALQIESDTLTGRIDLLTTIKCTEMPTSLKGFYSYTGESVDTLTVLALFHQGDRVTEAVDAMASSVFVAAGGPSEFTEFEVPFEYPAVLNADSMTLLIVVQKDVTNSAIGTFRIDQLSLEETSTSLSDIEISYQLIAPNPAFDHLEVLSSDVERIEILNFSGQLVLDINQPLPSIDVSSLVSGSYVAKSVVGEKVVVQKFIKL